MDNHKLLRLYREESKALVEYYLSKIERISGRLSASMISSRFWDFNLLMQELEQDLNRHADKMMDLYASDSDQKQVLQHQMQQIAREACRNFNTLGKPGSNSS